MAIARVPSCRSRTTETIILSNSSQCHKVGENKRTTQRSTRVDGIKRRKKEQQRGGTKKQDQSLQGTTTTGTCDTSDQNETSIETNSRQRTISKGGHEATIVYNKYVSPQEETSNDNRKKRTTNRKSNKNNHTTSNKTTTRVTTAASK